MFIVNCAGCDHPLRLPDAAAGKAIRCRKCKTIMLIPKKRQESSDYAFGTKPKHHVEKE